MGHNRFDYKANDAGNRKNKCPRQQINKQCERIQVLFCSQCISLLTDVLKLNQPCIFGNFESYHSVFLEFFQKCNLSGLGPITSEKNCPSGYMCRRTARESICASILPCFYDTSPLHFPRFPVLISVFTIPTHPALPHTHTHTTQGLTLTAFVPG